MPALTKSMSFEPIRYFRAVRRFYLRGILLFACAFSCGLHGYAQDSLLLHKTFAERAPLLNRFYTRDIVLLDSVTVFAHINRIRKLAVGNNDDDLLMETALMRLEFISNRKLPHTLVLSAIDSVNREVTKHGVSWLQIMTEDMLATYNFNSLQHYEQAFEHAQRMYDMMKKLSPMEFPFKSNFLSQMAEMHYFFSDYRQSIFYNLQAVQAEISVPLEGFPIGINVLNNIGLSYQELNMTDSAEYYFRATISLAKKRKNEAWDGIGNGNLGYILFLKGKYMEAAPLLQKDVNIAVKRADWGLASGSLMVLANISLLDGNLTAAGKQIDSCRLYVSRSGQYKRYKRLYALMSKYYSLTHQPEPALQYLDSSTFVNDSLNRKFSALLLLRASQKIDLERNRAAVASIESQKAINILERDGLAGILFLLIVITYLLYNRQKIIVKKNEAALQLEKAEVQQERDAARLALIDYTDRLRQQIELVESFKADLDNTQREADPEYQSRIAELERMMKAHIMTDKAWKEFKSLFDKVHPHFFTLVNNRFQHLTDTDIRLLALIRLRLNNTEMAGMLGISAEGVRKSKQRLRKRIAIADESSLEEVVAGI